MAFKRLNKENLLYNVNYFKKILPLNTFFCAVVKSNAYGHGVKEVVEEINNYVDYYAVTSIKEGAELRNYTKKNILVLRGFGDDENLFQVSNCDLELAVFTLADIEKLAREDREIKVHIALNTGMNRLGFRSNKEIDLALKKLQGSKNIRVVGVFSHISDYLKKRRVKEQVKNFLVLSRKLDKRILKHISNSGTAIKFNEYLFNMARIGIGLYGYASQNLKPVMEVYAKVIDKQIVRKGEYVGYGSKCKVKNNTLVAILDIGYAEGLPRIYGKKGYVIINNNLCKILGNICMSMTIVDVRRVNCKIGDEAIIIGKSENYSITAEDIAKDCKTISYEILTNFAKLQLGN